MSHLLDFAIIGVSVTVKLHESEPAEFAAVHVTVVVPTGKVEPEGGVQVTVAPFVAVGVGYVTTPPVEVVAVTVILTGHAITGGCVAGVSVTVKLHVSDPAEFVAVQVTVVVPIGKVEPEAGVQVTVAPLVAVGVGYVTTPPVEVVAVTIMLIGQVIIGGCCCGVTVTVKLHDAEPAEFIAVQVTVVVPSGKVEPDGGVQVTVAPFVAVGVG